jgi:hypothetical protein
MLLADEPSLQTILKNASPAECQLRDQLLQFYCLALRFGLENHPSPHMPTDTRFR